LGASAPLKELQRKFGFEPDHVAAAERATGQEVIGIGPRSNIQVRSISLFSSPKALTSEITFVVCKTFFDRLRRDEIRRAKPEKHPNQANVQML